MTRRVFVTGATGTVGHYVVEALLERGDLALDLLVRDPARLRLPLPESARVLTGDLLDLDAHRSAIAEADAVVHLATAWGDPVAYGVNVDASVALLDHAGRAQAFLYFSTASILGPGDAPAPEAETLGTDYIRSKYQAYRRLRAHPASERVVALFPTLIFGGSEAHPVSHLSRGLPGIVKALPLLRFFRLDGTLHFIHARDIARMVAHLIDHPAPARDLVLGNAPTRVDALIGALCEARGLARPFSVDLTPLAPLVARLAGDRMTPWDRHCLTVRHFRHASVNPRALGLTPGLETIGEILDEARLARR